MKSLSPAAIKSIGLASSRSAPVYISARARASISELDSGIQLARDMHTQNPARPYIYMYILREAAGNFSRGRAARSGKALSPGGERMAKLARGARGYSGRKEARSRARAAARLRAQSEKKTGARFRSRRARSSCKCGPGGESEREGHSFFTFNLLGIGIKLRECSWECRMD